MNVHNGFCFSLVLFLFYLPFFVEAQADSSESIHAFHLPDTNVFALLDRNEALSYELSYLTYVAAHIDSSTVKLLYADRRRKQFD